MTSLDKKIIRAYLWQDVIRLGFRPTGEKEQKKWLRKYHKSLKDFLELGSYPVPPDRKDEPVSPDVYFRLPFNLDIEGSITQTDKFTIKFLYLPPGDKLGLMWDHEVDGTYFTFPVQDFLTIHNQRKAVLGKLSDEDIKAVLDGLIFHPAAHQHIESPIDKHEIRIGGGIGNAFQFLFHLRYQLCPIKEKRKAEKKRLVELFKNAVRENSELTTSQLMAQP